MVRKISIALLALVGLAVLVVVGFVSMPARAVKLVTDRVDGVALSVVAGRVWKGEADIAYEGRDIGRLGWSLKFPALLAAELAIDWRLSHPDFSMTGTVAQGPGAVSFAATGAVDSSAVNRFLGEYYIALEGVFDIDDFAVRIEGGDAAVATGQLRWTGGRTVYRLSGRTHDVELPGMVGTLASVDGEPVLEATSADDHARLLHARLDRAGWVHIGVTARLANLAGNPWPGADNDDDVVVTVSERLFEPGVDPQGEQRTRQ